MPHFISHMISFYRGEVRNLGKPVALCKQYYDGGADEVVFLNITSFRQGKKSQFILMLFLFLLHSSLM